MRLFYTLGFLIARAKFEYALGARDGFAPRITDLESKVVAVIRSNPTGNYIEAIKLHRALFNTGLKDAKDAVDALYVKNGLVR